MLSLFAPLPVSFFSSSPLSLLPLVSFVFQWVPLTTCHRRGYMKTATTSNLTSGR